MAVRAWAPVAAVVVSITVVAAMVALWAMRRAGDPSEGGSPAGVPSTGDPPDGADPRPGAPVEGIGVLLRAGTGPIRLCAEVARTADLPTSRAGCSPVSVAVIGVDPAWLVHTTTAGQAYSDPVRVEGVYRAGTLIVNRVEHRRPEPAEAPTEPPLPCPPPPGGWRPGDGLEPAGSGAAQLDRLVAQVRARPDRYTDLWEGHPSGVPAGGGEPPVKVMVVGTTGDLARDRAALAAVFPGNLCVHPVSHSAADLRAVADRLRSVRFTPIQAEPDVIHGKVRVKVVALDPATVAVLDEVGRDVLSLDEPMLQWLD